MLIGLNLTRLWPTKHFTEIFFSQTNIFQQLNGSIILASIKLTTDKLRVLVNMLGYGFDVIVLPANDLRAFIILAD